MTGPFNAYRNDPRVKEAALAGAAKPAAPGDVWWPVNNDAEALQGYCQDNGLQPALFQAVRALNGPSGEGEVSPALDAFLSALTVGADTTTILPEFMVWLWEGRAEDSLEAVLKGSSAEDPARRLVSLHRSADAVSRQQWRQARNALAAAEGLTPAQHAAANVVAAMGWDFASTPGAGADLVHTCFGEATSLVDEEMSWTEADNEAFKEAITRQFGIAHQEMGDPPADRSDRVLMTPYMEGFQAVVERVATEDEKALRARMEKIGAVKQAQVQTLAETMQAALNRTAAGAPALQTA